ncbi:hypothetical protein QAD02_003393 [Eretmocerus hayati]|uniref:Uncharacterized protein n=1 Tax=Eretmocerus hayati TaxID=131215 RepID=A0ACC2NM06_9HYME|nr:hypothetical protein QAD02_003393 [Eretmocerus hayati]
MKGGKFYSHIDDTGHLDVPIPPSTQGTMIFRETRVDNTFHCLSSLKMLATKKAKRVKFFRNGDKFYSGVVIPVTAERYRSFDSLISDLTRVLTPNVTLPSGVRMIHSLDGRRIQGLDDLEDGESYVVSGYGEIFKNIDYSSITLKRHSSGMRLSSHPSPDDKLSYSPSPRVRAKIITLIRNGTKPRKIVRLLLNKRNSPNLEHVFKLITEVIRLDTGSVKKAYKLSGQQITMLEQFFEEDDIFLVYGLEKVNPNDFELDPEELKSIRGFRQSILNERKHEGPIPKMPTRKKDKSYSAGTCSGIPHALTLDTSFRSTPDYSIGKVIGEGNFALVRECMHK